MSVIEEIRVNDPTFIVRRDDGIRQKVVRVEKREIDYVASSDAIDSYDEVVEQTWRLERFLANPVVLWAHQSRELPLGRCPRVEMVAGKLECTVNYMTEKLNPKAEQVFQMGVEGYVKAVSVGFRPRTIRWEKRDGRDIYVLSDNELVEISVTPIGANPDALAKDAGLDGFISIPAREYVARHLAAHPANPKGASRSVSYPTPTQSTAPSKVRGPENSMTEEQLKAENTKLVGDLAVAKSQLELSTSQKSIVEAERDALRSTAKAFEEKAAELTKLLGEKDEAVKAATLAKEEALGKLVELEVDGLIGKKLTPAQKETFVALAKKDHASFELVVKGLPDLPFTSEAKIPTSQPNEERSIAPTPGEPAVPALGALLGKAEAGDTDDLGSLL